MDEPEPDPTAPAAKEPVADAVVEESAVARGSQVIAISPERSGRSEHSVVEGMPDATKTERIASMRRELADLQQHLIQAQQRVATELQGRVDDAERLEALEAFVQQHEVNSVKDATRVGELEAEIAALRAQLSAAISTTEGLRRDVATRDGQIEEGRRELEARSSAWTEAKTVLEARAAELAAHTTERDDERATRSRLELELEDVRREHRNVADQLDLQFTSLRDAKALITTLTAEITTTTAERDALKTELDPARRDLDTARTKLRDVAIQLVRLGQDMADGSIVPATATSTTTSTETAEAKPATTSVKRTQPPPIPQTPQARPPTAPVVETIVMTEEAKPASRIGSALFMIGGVIVGCVVTIVIMKSSGSSSSTTDEVGATPPPAPVQVETSPRHDDIRPAPTATAPSSADTPATAPITAPANTATEGVIVVPASAAGHRVFVDGKVVEIKSSRASIACGSHEIRIGSSGIARKLDIACGGETVLPDEPN